MNTKTELLMIFGGNLLVFILLLTYKKKGADSAIRMHFYSQGAITLFYPLAAMRFVSSFWAFSYVSSGLVILSCFFEGLALARLADSYGPGIRRYLMWTLLGGLVLYTVAFLTAPGIYIRVIVLSLVNAFLLVPTTALVLKKRDASPLRYVLGTFFLLMIASLVLRIVDALRLGEDLVLFGPSLGEQATFYSLYVYIFLGGMGIVLLSKEKADSHLEKLAYMDEATGLLNRNGFRSSFDEASATAVYDNESFTLILAELEGLGCIDETEGPEAADQAVERAARALEELAGKRGFAGRLAGGRFAAFIRDCGSQDLERLSEDFEGMDSLPLIVAGLAFDCPAGKTISFDAVYVECIAVLREAKAKGPSGRILRPA